MGTIAPHRSSPHVCLRAFGALIILTGLGSRPAGAQEAPRGSSVRGVVRAAGGGPLVGSSVVRLGTPPDSVASDTGGRFVLLGLARGHHYFTVRHVGFVPVDFEVTFLADTSVDVDVPLEQHVIVLDTIRVRGAEELGLFERKLRAVGFEERREQAERSATDATFLTPEDIGRRRPLRLSHLLEGSRSVKIGYAGIIAVAYGRDGRCVMSVWLDGQEMRNLFPVRNEGRAFSTNPGSPPNPASTPGLDLIAASDIAAVEIYPSPSGTPPQFQNLTGMCGAIVIWTKQ